MTILQNTFEGGTDGVVITTGNSGGASGDAFSLVNGSPTFEDSPTINGGFVGAFPAANDYVRVGPFASTTAVCRFGVRLTVATGLSGVRLAEFRNGSQGFGRIIFSASNIPFLQAPNGTNIGALGATAMLADTDYLFELAAESSNAGDATVKARFALASDPTVDIGSASSTTISQGTTANIDRLQLGRAATDSYAGIIYIDEILAEDGTLTYPGIWAPPAAYLSPWGLLDGAGGHTPMTMGFLDEQ